MQETKSFESLDSMGRVAALVADTERTRRFRVVNTETLRDFGIIDQRNLAFNATGLPEGEKPEQDSSLQGAFQELSRMAAFVLSAANIDEIKNAIPDLHPLEKERLQNLVRREPDVTFYMLSHDAVQSLKDIAPPNVDMKWLQLRRCDHQIRLSRKMIEQTLQEDPAEDVSFLQEGIDVAELMKKKIEAGEPVDF